jgi:cysteine synthase A
MKIANNVTELVGNTPLVKLNRITEGCGATIVAKLEFFNPAIASRTASRSPCSMRQAAGKIGPDTVVLEPTSGNTGIGLAMVCAARGIKCAFRDAGNDEPRAQAAAQGLRRRADPDAGAGRHDRRDQQGRELAAADPRYFIPQQFENPANPAVHRNTTAEEIWRDTDGQVDIFVSGVGTGGTVTGVGEVLKDKKPGVQDRCGRAGCLAGAFRRRQGAAPDPGHRRRFRPGVLNTAIYDEVIRVKNDDAFAIARRMATEEGLLVGISSGAATWAALELAKRPENAGKLIVVIIPSFGERYLSTALYQHLEV